MLVDVHLWQLGNATTDFITPIQLKIFHAPYCTEFLLGLQ